MLSHTTPASIARANREADAILARQIKERGTGINARGAEPDLTPTQRNDFAAALSARKAG